MDFRIKNAFFGANKASGSKPQETDYSKLYNVKCNALTILEQALQGEMFRILN
jgi:hypothetical protein